MPEHTHQNNNSDRENNIETDRTVTSKFSDKHNDAYYHEDEEFEYYRVPKKELKIDKKAPDKKELKTKEVSIIQDTSFKDFSLVGGSALNLRF